MPGIGADPNPKAQSVNFLIDNILVVAVAVLSGVALLVNSLRGRAGAGVTPAEATRLVNQRHAVLIDVRAPEDFAKGHIPQARNIQVADLEQKTNSISKDKPLVVICGSGRDATKAAVTLRAKGFNEVVVLAGGMGGWNQAGLPVAKA